MEQENIKTNAQEQTAALRGWVTPTFERAPLNEAQGPNPLNVVGLDGSYGGS